MTPDEVIQGYKRQFSAADYLNQLEKSLVSLADRYPHLAEDINLIARSTDILKKSGAAAFAKSTAIGVIKESLSRTAGDISEDTPQGRGDKRLLVGFIVLLPHMFAK